MKSKPTVLVVDDIEINLIILEEILKSDYEVVCLSSGIAAVEKLFSGKIKPTIILLDIRMPEMDGYEVLARLKKHPELKKIPVIFITAENSEMVGLAAGAADYISKPFQPEIIKLRVANQIKFKLNTDYLEELLIKKTEELQQSQGRILEAMANIIEYRDLESGDHVKRTADLTMILINYMLTNSIYAQQLMELDPPTIVRSVPLHDLGKIGVPDSILLKPGKLTEEEFEVIKTHTTIGKDIVESILQSDDSLYLKHCRDICYCHHERFDGKGYPCGISGTNIPLSARLVSVVDVYDALTSARVYKPAFPHEKAVEIIVEGSGTQFDPEIIRCFEEIADEFRSYMNNSHKHS